jgi:hypothetical protein
VQKARRGFRSGTCLALAGRYRRAVGEAPPRQASKTYREGRLNLRLSRAAAGAVRCSAMHVRGLKPSQSGVAANSARSLMTIPAATRSRAQVLLLALKPAHRFFGVWALRVVCNTSHEVVQALALEARSTPVLV